MAAIASTPQDARTAPVLSGPYHDPRGGGMSRGGGDARTPWTISLRTGRNMAIVTIYRFAHQATAEGYRDGFAAALKGLKGDRPRKYKDKSIEYLHGYRTGHLEGLQDLHTYGGIS